MKKVAIIALLLALSQPIFSAEINTAGKIFLLETGARSLAMGGCGTLIGEAYSGKYNPAALALTPDVCGSIYLNPHPYFGPNHDYVDITFGARSEFGYIGFSYFLRNGVEGTDYPDEEGSALVLAGWPSRKLNIAWGVAFKILTTSKAGFIPINESWTKAYKMAFDLGLVFSDLLPETTFGGQRTEWHDTQIWRDRSYGRGISVGLAFQNLGGKIEYDDTPDFDMLPQTFRADLRWIAYQDEIVNFQIAGQLHKLLVFRKRSDNPDHPVGGYNKATEAFFQAWGGGDREGGWTSRLGFEAAFYDLFAGRIGWSKDYKNRISFIYYGLGAGPKWARFNIAREHQPGSDVDFTDELRYDLTAGISYEKLRNWIRE